MIGRSRSRTCTMNEHTAVLYDVSVARSNTDVEPTVKLRVCVSVSDSIGIYSLPICDSYLMMPMLSYTCNAVYVMVAYDACERVYTVTSAGQRSIGAMLSMMLT